MKNRFCHSIIGYVIFGFSRLNAYLKQSTLVVSQATLSFRNDIILRLGKLIDDWSPDSLVFIRNSVWRFKIETKFLFHLLLESESPTFGQKSAFSYGGRSLLSPVLTGPEDGFQELSSANRTSRATPNEISAPYEVPQFPIEEIERKLAIQRQLSLR